MKFVKLSVLALSMGLFVASCGNGSGEAAKTDTVAAPVVVAPAPAPAPADTAKAVVVDTVKPAATASETKVTEKKEVKKK